MSASVLPRPVGSRPAGAGGIRLGIILALAAWFVLVVLLGASGAFVGRPGRPPVAIAIGAGTPLLLFFACLRFSSSFRAYVHSLDLRLITGMQAWRWAGMGFLALYAHDVLPAMFALPAGFGDMAVGFVAPWMSFALARRPDFAASPAFVRWNALGMLDLVLAIALGALSASLSTGAPGEVAAAPMATLPLLAIPVFLVPLFLMLHTAALMQSRRMVRSREAREGAARRP